MTDSDAASRLRWETVGENDAQASLFPDPARRVTHPEFADMEFLHVRAKRLINEVPAAANLPFRYTINVYRGCSHACTYCAAGDTPVLMADGWTRPLADVCVGDAIMGTERAGSYRRYVTTTVLDHWRTTKPAYRVTLEDGTELVTSGDHRLLTKRGWKHVTGAQQGRRRRSHLTTQDKLLGTGAFADPPSDTAEYRRGYLTGMIRGDGTMGTYEDERAGRRSAAMCPFRLALVDLQALDRSRAYLERAGIPTSERPSASPTTAGRPLRAITNQSSGGVDAIRRLIAWPSRPCPDWQTGFLAGIFDAEGSYSHGVLRFHGTDARLLDQIAACLRLLAFDAVLEPARMNGCPGIRIRGGLREHLRFFHTVDPAISRKRVIDGTALKSDASLGVTSVESLGVELPLYDMTTGTGDYIANGVVNHNCFARPTHEYLNLGAGADFERVVVVKLNAVQALRRELRPARWRGEHIAMGTNTDPYQRCEGRYRLTRGVVETLTAAANPFSILTKSPLVLRDLDVLEEANARTDIAVNFSIGTLDTEVWRASEPGAPHPRRRIEAVAALREAGIPSGVLVAPVLPGISDGEEQLAEVVRACVDAGATTVSPIALHLRPGVREHFLPWLEDVRPDLLRRYSRMYSGAYAPADVRKRIAGTVRGLVERFGGLASSPAAARGVRPREEPRSGDGPPGSDQLTLPVGL